MKQKQKEKQKQKQILYELYAKQCSASACILPFKLYFITQCFFLLLAGNCIYSKLLRICLFLNN